MKDLIPGVPVTTLGLGCALVVGLIVLAIAIRNR